MSVRDYVPLDTVTETYSYLGVQKGPYEDRGETHLLLSGEVRLRNDWTL